MTRSTTVLALLLCGANLPACKRQGEDASLAAVVSALPAPTQDPAPSATPTASASSSADPEPPDSIEPARQPASIDACCDALHALRRSRAASTRSKAARASEICPGIASLVRQGVTPRSAGLTQLRSALGPVQSPPECQ